MIAEKITAVARRRVFHSEKSATSAIIAQSSGIGEPVRELPKPFGRDDQRQIARRQQDEHGREQHRAQQTDDEQPPLADALRHRLREQHADDRGGPCRSR
jgi:hypothetical protein